MTIYHLYVKTHNVTGLKYLGQTSQDPFVYRGSGNYWKHHLNVHGKNVSTLILLTTESKTELKETGIFFSKLWNVVKSDEWANLKEESGQGGGMRCSDETKAKMSAVRKGRPSHRRGKKMSDETRNRMSIAKMGTHLSEQHKMNISRGLRSRIT